MESCTFKNNWQTRVNNKVDRRPGKLWRVNSRVLAYRIREFHLLLNWVIAWGLQIFATCIETFCTTRSGTCFEFFSHLLLYWDCWMLTCLKCTRIVLLTFRVERLYLFPWYQLSIPIHHFHSIYPPSPLCLSRLSTFPPHIQLLTERSLQPQIQIVRLSRLKFRLSSSSEQCVLFL